MKIRNKSGNHVRFEYETSQNITALLNELAIALHYVDGRPLQIDFQYNSHDTIIEVILEED